MNLKRIALLAIVFTVTALGVGALVVAARDGDSSLPSGTDAVGTTPTGATEPSVSIEPPSTSGAVTVTSGPTTSTSTTAVSADLPGTIVMGRVVSMSHPADFSAFRNADERIVIGPTVLTTAGFGEVAVPAGTIIDRLCTELDIALPGEQPPVTEPCVVRVDIGEDGAALDVFVMTPRGGRSNRLRIVEVKGEVIGATPSSVILFDRKRDRPVAWPLRNGVEFRCVTRSWEPPEYPQPPELTYYVMIVNVERGAVIRLECELGF